MYEDKLLLTVTEAAGRLGIARSFAYRLVLAGTINSVKIGKARRIPTYELDRYIRQLLDEQQQ